MARLVVINQSLAGSIHELGENWATIGRGDGNTFQLLESSVSGRHCEVRVRDNELVVRDLDDEVLVYDLNKHEAITLNPFAAAVWRACDGTRSASELTAMLQQDLPANDVPEESIWRALDMLSQCDLLEERVIARRSTADANSSRSWARARI